MASLAERYALQSTVTPHWLPSGTALWYRRESAALRSKTEFLFADADGRRPAFDHAALATRLAEHTGQDVDAAALPFSWIELAPGAEDVRFRFAGQVHRYVAATGALEAWDGEFGTVLVPLDGEPPSDDGGAKAGITLVNRTAAVAAVFWIDRQGEAVVYGEVEAGKELEIRTYVGHVWRVEGTGGHKAVYRAEEGEGTIIIEGWGEAAKPEAELAVREKRAEEAGSEKKLEGREDAALESDEREIFIRDDNVWIRDAEGEHKITGNDSSAFRYDANDLTKSPDGKFAVAWEYTPEEGYSLTLVESTPSDQLQPKRTTTTYLKPGDKVRVDRPRMFDIEARREVPTEDALFQNPYSLRHLGWSDSGEYRFIFNERGHKRLRVIGMNRQGAVRAIVDESSETFINYSQKMDYRSSPDSTELLWASEREGWNHFYLYDMEAGEVKNQVTQGEWVVRDIERVDWETRQLWLQVYGVVPDQDPYYAHLVRVNLDGSGLTVLTEGDGTHTWSWSPNRQYLIDTWSRVDQLPVTVLRDAASGQQLAELEADDTASLVAEGWSSPEIFVAPGRDAKTPIYGLIVRPKDFNPNGKYAVVEDIYAGPQDFFTPKAFAVDLGPRDVADNGGFVVVKLDGMGTNWRSKAFHDVCYKNLQDGGFPDRIPWIQAAASTRPWMDLSRVGIYGGSAGGQNAAAALIFHGGDKFYKAAAADCGCHDNRLDKMWWNEQWMGWPVDGAYAASSNVVHAAKMEGALMLTVGELDDNVDPASTLQLVKALNDADKDYEMLLMPGKGHGAGGSDYGRRRRLQFFRRWLGVDNSI